MPDPMDELKAVSRKLDAAISDGRGDIETLRALRALVNRLESKADNGMFYARALRNGKKLDGYQKRAVESLESDFAAISAEIRALAPKAASARNAGDYNVSVAPSPARWSHQPLVAIRSPFTFNSGGNHARRNRRPS